MERLILVIQNNVFIMKHFIKQKSTLLVLMLLSLFIFWCYNNKINNNNEEILWVIESWNLEIFDDSENISATKRLVITWNHQFWEFEIPSGWLIYRDEKHGFQIKFWSERSGWKIYDSFDILKSIGEDAFYRKSTPKHPFIFASMPSPWRSDEIEMIAIISYLTNKQYLELKELCEASNSICDPSVEERIIWENNKYYISWIWWFARQFEELAKIFYPHIALETITLDDGTEEWWTFSWSQYVLDNFPFLFVEYEIFDVK